MDPDPGGPKSYGFYGSRSAILLPLPPFSFHEFGVERGDSQVIKRNKCFEDFG
jgi:hypothetical protein